MAWNQSTQHPGYPKKPQDHPKETITPTVRPAAVRANRPGAAIRYNRSSTTAKTGIRFEHDQQGEDETAGRIPDRFPDMVLAPDKKGNHGQLNLVDVQNAEIGAERFEGDGQNRQGRWWHGFSKNPQACTGPAPSRCGTICSIKDKTGRRFHSSGRGKGPGWCKERGLNKSPAPA